MVDEKAKTKTTPLQDEKEGKLDDLLDKKKIEVDKPDKKPEPKKPEPKKRAPRKKKLPAPPPDPEVLKKEGMFFVDLDKRAQVGRY